MELREYKAKIYEAIKELNENPSFEKLGRVESMIDFYSDCYKDEYYHRPSCAEFRYAYEGEAMELFEKWHDLSWDEQLKYMGYGDK